jgi:hypothetical protein
MHLGAQACLESALRVVEICARGLAEGELVATADQSGRQRIRRRHMPPRVWAWRLSTPGSHLGIGCGCFGTVPSGWLPHPDNRLDK